jgi:hypothetical protein
LGLGIFVNRIVLIFKSLFVAALLMLFSSVSSAANYSSEDINNPSFEDISTSGQVVLENCDDCAVRVDIGFEFTFYGRTYTRLNVLSNGLVTFDGTDLIACCGLRMEIADGVAGILAPWWTDLSMQEEPLSETVKEEDGKIFTKLEGSPGSYRFIIQYNNVRHFHNLRTDDSNTFQIKLLQENNNVEFHYKNIVTNNNSHTIGIESPQQAYQLQGITYLPEGFSNFAVAFVPPEKNKLTSSVRYVSAGNTFTHGFEVNQSVSDISEVSILQSTDGVCTGGTETSGDATIMGEINYDSPIVVSTSPTTKFSVEYTVLESLGFDAASAQFVYGEYIDFCLDGSDEFYTLEAQSILVSQVGDASDSVKASNAAFGRNETLSALVSKDNVLDVATAPDGTADNVYFTGQDNESLEFESFQLTNLSGNAECGPPYIDATGEQRLLYVICTTGSGTNVILHKYNLDTYLDDDLSEEGETIAATEHSFSSDVRSTALVAAAAGNYVYSRDAGGGHDVYLNGTKINLASGEVKSVAIDSSGTKVVFVIDNTVYFYQGSLPAETINNDGVTSAHISFDGSTIAFNSTGNLDVGVGNSDASLEIFTVPAASPFTTFTQKTELAAGTCKFPLLSEKAERIFTVCDEDLLNLGNNFDAREAVFLIEDLPSGDTVAHLLTSQSDSTQNISRISASANSARLSFEDASDSRTYELSGFSGFNTRVQDFSAKEYPVPYKLPGDGKSSSGRLYALLVLLAFSFIFKRYSLALRKTARNS